MDFAIPTDHRVKIEDRLKLDNYLDLASELKNPWNTKVMVTPIVLGALGMVLKGLEK